MSRVIKFRGYSYEKQSWLYGNLIEKDNPQIKKPTSWVRLIHNRALSAEIVVFESVGQFTGLHDKNGKEIFEGDLVNYKYLEGDKPFEVIFDEDVAAFKIAKDEYYMGFLGDKKRDEIEVIGNIWDNLIYSNHETI